MILWIRNIGSKVQVLFVYACITSSSSSLSSNSIDVRAVPGDFHNHFSPEFPILNLFFQLSELHPYCFLHTIHPSGTGSTLSPNTFYLSYYNIVFHRSWLLKRVSYITKYQLYNHGLQTVLRLDLFKNLFTHFNGIFQCFYDAELLFFFVLLLALFCDTSFLRTFSKTGSQSVFTSSDCI